MSVVMKYLYYYLHRGSFFEVSFQMLLLSSLVAVFAWYILRQQPAKDSSYGDDEKDEEIIRRFEPEELIPAEKGDATGLRKRIVSSLAGRHIVVDGHTCLNLATQNYLSLVEDADVQSRATESINKYGVGSCGPRGFYGTVDVHLELEEKLAEFMEVEEACVYSYSFSTMASVVPAYCKRGDVVFADEAVNFSIQKGLDASRSTVHYFKHNDMDDLERLLLDQRKIDEKNPKKAARTRKFLIAEGIYMNTGRMCNLPELVRLRKEHKLRMLLDESVSFGTVGATGKGVVEHFNIPNIEVDLRVGSLEGALASVGGFCCGASFIVEHQRLSGLGYCFSASLPPVLAVAALTSLDHIIKNPDLFSKLKQVNSWLQASLSKLSQFDLSGDVESPIKHLYLKRKSDYASEKKVLNDVVDYCIERNVAIVVPEYLDSVEKFPVRASLRVMSNISLTEEDVEFVCRVISEACENCLSI